jgi:hypothetical protein
LINEEALLLARYLKNEMKDWLPRIAFRFGEQDKQVTEFLLFRKMIKAITRQIQNEKQENIETR